MLALQMMDNLTQKEIALIIILRDNPAWELLVNGSTEIKWQNGVPVFAEVTIKGKRRQLNK